MFNFLNIQYDEGLSELWWTAKLKQICDYTEFSN